VSAAAAAAVVTHALDTMEVQLLLQQALLQLLASSMHLRLLQMHAMHQISVG
jgi:hypothetical protein